MSTYEWEAAYREWVPTKVMDEAHLRRRRCLLKERNIDTIQVHQQRRWFPRRTICASDMKYFTIEATYEDEDLYNRITPKAENHRTTRSALLSKYIYRYITRMQRHPRVKCANEDEGPTDENHCTREAHLQSTPWHLRWSTEMIANEKR